MNTTRGVLRLSGGQLLDGFDCDNKHWLKATRFAIMQYTGLKDKNGCDIYEGDVLIKKGLDYYSEEFRAWEDSKYEGPEPEHVEIRRDVCSLEVFRYWLKNESFGYEGEGLEDPSQWEIIGNIHENPELLQP